MIRTTRLVAAALLAVLSACSASSPGDPRLLPDTPQPAVDGGTVRVALPWHPSSLVPTGDDGQAARTILEPVLLGAYRTRPDFSYEPQLLEADADVSHGPFSVTYRIAQAARWNDGTQITADDFLFTARQQRGEHGYELIRRGVKVSDKTVTFEFRRPFAQFRSLFDPVLPAHAFDPEGWRHAVPVASGPLEFDFWKDSRIVLKRNENYWGPPSHLDEVIVELRGKDAPQLVAGRELDVAETGLDRTVEQARGMANVVVNAVSGSEAVMLTMAASLAPTNDRRVREAVAVGLDRERLIEALVQPVQPSATVLQSAMTIDGLPHHARPFATIEHDLRRARELLDAAGCRLRGAWRSCRTGRMVLRHAAGRTAEERAIYALLAEDLRQLGILVEASPGGGNVSLRTWRWPWPARHNYGQLCQVGRRTACSARALAMLRRSEEELRPDQAATFRDAAADLLTPAGVVLPLYQRPVVQLWHDEVQGIQANASASGLLWNAGDWFIAP